MENQTTPPPTEEIRKQVVPRPELEVAYVPPGNETEEKLVAIWQDVLLISGLGIEDNFYELGAHSLAATKITGRIHKEFNITPSVQKVVSKTTIKKLAVMVQSLQEERNELSELEKLLAEIEE